MKHRAIVLLIISMAFQALAAPWNGKVVLQGFWWDYWNNNYPNNWSTYLADLAPRLREMGIDAVWIPPTVKNKNATGSVGYSPFDHYDLGDKFQGGSTGTRFGTKDEYLRAVAILHANGIEVIQDMVWNHMDGAGTETGAGGEDPAAPSNKWKNFRYASYATPGSSNDAANYGGRRGRFSKNWQNFHPNADHNTEGDDITAGFFGPDICYYSQARGLSSNSSYNPAQGVDYMRNGMRNWSVWMKKQTGVDGFRIDAAKHFETWATQDFLWNLAFNAGFASGGNQMYAVGEWIGSAAQMDGWIDGVNSANGGQEDLVGTFDFNLRGAIKSMIDGVGSYNLASIPGAQQSRRSRTAPFVNSHDTFRPILDGSGRYIGWNSGNEIGGHVDPNDARIQAAYALAMAVDGSPNVFFEDLFDLHSTGKRWTHSPTNRADLPARSWLTNQIWCYQNLKFKEGAYKVRAQTADLLVIERSGRAIIAVNDNGSNAQSATVQTDFGADVLLHDYSGAYPTDIRTDANGRALIQAPPCNSSNLRRGYSIWGRVGLNPVLLNASRSVAQEWEMADDLGDSHPSSLRQGGALPANSTASRTVGRIFTAAGMPVTVEGFPSVNTARWQISVVGAGLSTNIVGSGNLTLRVVPVARGYHTITVQNEVASNPSQVVWVKATYTAPASRFSPALQIAQEPENQFAVAGESVGLKIAVTPGSQIQWLKVGVEIPGATSASLVLTNVGALDAANYSARVWNEAATLISETAVVTVYANPEPAVENLIYSDEGFSFNITGPNGLQYIIERSGNLFDWIPMQTNTAPFAASDNLSQTQQFYRISYLPAGVLQ